ncbi:unnamed protein product, partial [Ostreobium quekettii]
DDATVTAHSCIFINNSAKAYGGAIAVQRHSTATINKCNFTDNNANDGGALGIQGQSTIESRSCVYENNTAEIDGGAIATDGSTANISNSTLVGNGANNSGGAIFIKSRPGKATHVVWTKDHGGACKGEGQQKMHRESGNRGSRCVLRLQFKLDWQNQKCPSGPDFWTTTFGSPSPL